jgi:putative effector of murein hydrolase LrgA (UPF0299 family)
VQNRRGRFRLSPQLSAVRFAGIGPDVSKRGLSSAPAPEEASRPGIRARLLARWRVIPGLAILSACFLAGQTLHNATGIIVPGNMLGLFLMLVLLATRIVRLEWIEEAATLLLWLLPLLFLPPFVTAAQDRSYWADPRGLGLAGAVLVGLLALWVIVGHAAQWLLARFPGHESEPGPLTDAELKACTAAILQEEEDEEEASVAAEISA